MMWYFTTAQVAPTMEMFDPFGESVPLATTNQPTALQPQDPFLTPRPSKTQSFSANHMASPIRPQVLGKSSCQAQLVVFSFYISWFSTFPWSNDLFSQRELLLAGAAVR